MQSMYVYIYIQYIRLCHFFMVRTRTNVSWWNIEVKNFNVTEMKILERKKKCRLKYRFPRSFKKLVLTYIIMQKYLKGFFFVCVFLSKHK